MAAQVYTDRLNLTLRLAGKEAALARAASILSSLALGRPFGSKVEDHGPYSRAKAEIEAWKKTL